MSTTQTPATSSAGPEGAAPPGDRRQGRLARHAPLAVAAALVLGFIAITVWWISVDARFPNGDSGKHTLIAFGYYDVISQGYPLSVLGQYNFYPPLVHFIGALGSLVAGPSVKVVVIAENVVFVPLLGAGCYGAARKAFGPGAGALAAIFAFAVPMIDSVFHVFMLDAPTAAVAAVSVWALLESDGFANVKISALAGVAVAAGMYAKSTFPIFVIGLIAVMLIRGGWRNRRGALAFAAVTLVLAGPWYLKHWDSIFGQTKGAIATQQLNWYGAVPYPDRFSLDNYTWYGWNLVNNQLYLPLTLFFVIGLMFFGWRWLGRRRPVSVTPELIAGGVVSYIGISLISLDDPRYTLPGLVYLAVLGTGWIVQVRRPLRIAAATALVAVLALNLVMTNLGKPDADWVLKLPGSVANPIAQNQLRVASKLGYDGAQPDKRGAKPLSDLLNRAYHEGARQVVFDPGSLNNGGYNLNGLAVIARSAGLGVPGFAGGLVRKPSDIYMFRALPEDKYGRPCIFSFAIGDGTAFYIQWGPVKNHKPDLHCPRK